MRGTKALPWCKIKVDQAIRLPKKTFCQENSADCNGNSGQIFQVVKEVTYNGVQSMQLRGLEVDRYELCEIMEIANAFNHHFVSCGPKLTQFLLVKKPPKTDQPAHHSMYFFRTNDNECPNVIQQLKSKHSSGPDIFSNVVHKICARAIAPLTSQLINIFVESGVYPDMLKKSKTILLQKSRCCKNLIN